MKENRIVFWGPPSTPEEDIGFWGGLGKLGSGLGKLAYSAATIVEHVAKLTESSVNLLDKGIRWADYGVDELEKYFKSKPDPTDLDEYKDMSDIEIGKNQPKSNVPEVQAVIDIQVRMSYLKYKQSELKLFYAPAVGERIRVGRELDQREGLESGYKSKIAELQANIRDNKNKLSKPEILSQMSNRDIGVATQALISDQIDLGKILSEIAKVIPWNKPELVKTSFPVGKSSIHYEYRFKANPDPSKKAEVDLETLYYNVLPRHIFKLKMKMEEYDEEIARLGYKNFLALRDLEKNYPDKMAKGGDWRKELVDSGRAIFKNLSDTESKIAIRMVDAGENHNISLVKECQKNSQPPVPPNNDDDVEYN